MGNGKGEMASKAQQKVIRTGMGGRSCRSRSTDMEQRWSPTEIATLVIAALINRDIYFEYLIVGSLRASQQMLDMRCERSSAPTILTSF
jgi:hypothetical protein